MSNNNEVQTLLDFAVKIAHESGEIALKYFRSDLQVENKTRTEKFDPVTLADKEIEAYLREKIKETYNEHTVIGEEAGTSEGTQSYKWLIDPIDGTRGFVSGSPVWGTLIGLMDGDKCVAGLMHQPFVNETYIGSGAGAYILNGSGKKPIKTSNKQKIADAILCTTHLSMFHNSRELDTFIKIAGMCRFSRLGTDCYGYALLAHGFVDLVVEAGLAAYDIMPLIPVIEAAGGVVTDWDGNPADKGGRVVAAANATLHEQVLKILAHHG